MSRVKLTADNMCHKPVQGGAAIEALIEVAKKGVDALDAWVSAGGDLNRVADSSNGITALHALVRRGANAKDEAAMARLLAAGADPNRQNFRGETPLFRASRNQLPAMVRLLVNHGADERICNRHHQSPEACLDRQDEREGGTQWAIQRQAARQVCRSTLRAGRIARELGEVMEGVPARANASKRMRL